MGRVPPSDAPDDTACVVHATRVCSCTGGQLGRQTCDESGAFDECECRARAATAFDSGVLDDDDDNASALAGNARSDITFDWERTEPDGLTCEPGHYEGSFAGLYYSRLNWPIAFPVIGVDLPGMPGLQFDMAPAEGGEVTLKVDGMFDGLADGLFPFRGRFIGELNCDTGKFTGMMLEGDYSIGPREILILENPIHFPFEGPLPPTQPRLRAANAHGRNDDLRGHDSPHARPPRPSAMTFQTRS
jgi:hypothetical protein